MVSSGKAVSRYHQKIKMTAQREIMKTIAKVQNEVRRLALLISISSLLGSMSAGGAPVTIVDETFTSPASGEVAGWQSGPVINVSRQYVQSGVRGSQALQVSAEFLTGGVGDVGTIPVQSGEIVGNELATRQNTELSFDLKVDRPDLNFIYVMVEGCSGFWYNWIPLSGLETGSFIRVPLGSYVPGKFMTVTMPIEALEWLEFWRPPEVGHFDPTSKTYQIMFSFGSEGLPALGKIAVTIDNIRVVSKNPSIPWKGAGSGQVTVDEEDGTVTVMEAGVATHLGAYTETVMFGSGGVVGNLQIVAANGDILTGKMYAMDPLEVIIEGGTGRFQGVKGSYYQWLNWLDPESDEFTSTSAGWISSLGLSR